jgi:LruC domain-containing protein
MRIKLLPIVLAIAIISCKKDNTNEGNQVTSINDLTVPSNFKWNTSNEVKFTVGISDSKFQNLVQVITIYSGNPDQGGEILSKGSATLLNTFTTKISIPASASSVYIVKSAPDGSKISERVMLTSNHIDVNFGSRGVTKTASAESSKKSNAVTAESVEAPTAEPDCQASVTGSDINFNSKQVICYTSANDATINISSNPGGTLKINAPGKRISIQNYNHTGLNIIIGANTTVIFSNLELKSNEEIINNGTLNITGKIDVNGTLTNNGTSNINFLQINGSGAVNNYCKLLVTDVQLDKVLNNYSYVQVSNNVVLNSSGRINMIGNGISGAMFQTNDMNTARGGINGSGATSLFKVTGTIDQNAILDAKQSSNRQVFSGNIELCTNQDIPDGFFIAPAKKGCEAYIAADGCISTGNGTPPVVIKDTDGDGINDTEDDYPTDPALAFKNYSVNYVKGGSTVAFEDNWPSKGDYDLNDIVIGYRYLVSTNAKNIVAQVDAEYSLIASGADFKNGAGVQFPLAAAKAKIITASAGMSFESKQDSAVLILFNNSKDLQLTGNTDPAKATSPVVKLRVSFSVIDGPNINDFGVGTYNPFIWNESNGYGRGYETHLYGKTPTNLVSASLFGTVDDRSKPSSGLYYRTESLLPWALELPIANFEYPIEGASILHAYTSFDKWAQSGGAVNKSWYNDSTNTNSSLVYTIK